MHIKTYQMTIASLFILTLGLAACAGPTPAAPTPLAGPFGYDELVEALQAAGAVVEPAGELEPDFFPVTAQVLQVDGQDVQVYEFDTNFSMMASVSSIDANGYVIGTTSIDWISEPYFFERDRVIALYVGKDQPTIDLLTSVMGRAFTGPHVGKP